MPPEWKCGVLITGPLGKYCLSFSPIIRRNRIFPLVGYHKFNIHFHISWNRTGIFCDFLKCVVKTSFNQHCHAFCFSFFHFNQKIELKVSIEFLCFGVPPRRSTVQSGPSYLWVLHLQVYLWMWNLWIRRANCTMAISYQGLEHPWILIYTDTRYLEQPPAVTKGWLFFCFLLSVFKQKYDSHGIGVNLLKCLDHLLITTVIGALWSSEWVLELLVLMAFSWGLLGEWASLEPRTYLQQVFLTSVLPVLFLPQSPSQSWTT